MQDALSLLSWRRDVAQMYADVRTAGVPEQAHALWRERRDELFSQHRQSPLAPDDPLRQTGLPYWPYDPALRLTAALEPNTRDETRTVDTAGDGPIKMRLTGHVTLPELGVGLDVWWFDQYAGGLFVPVRDATAGTKSYGGGRYLLDTAKGADLGTAADGQLVLDFNFLYHPSCRYSEAWSARWHPKTTPSGSASKPGKGFPPSSRAEQWRNPCVWRRRT